MVLEGLHETMCVAMMLSPSEKVMSYPALWRSSRANVDRRFLPSLQQNKPYLVSYFANVSFFSGIRVHLVVSPEIRFNGPFFQEIHILFLNWITRREEKVLCLGCLLRTYTMLRSQKSEVSKCVVHVIIKYKGLLLLLFSFYPILVLLLVRSHDVQ